MQCRTIQVLVVRYVAFAKCMNVCLSDGVSIQFVCLPASHLVVLPVYPSVGLTVSLSNCVFPKKGFQRLMAVVKFISNLSTVES